MSNIRNIVRGTVTVRDVIDDLQNRFDEIEEIYVVTVDKDMASRISTAGTLRNLAYAALSLTVHAQDMLRDHE